MSGLIEVLADESIECPCELDIQGINKIAPYNHDTRCFEVEDDILLTYLNREYRLVEYHYHTRGSHPIAGKTYKDELHMVFSDGAITGDLCQLAGVLKNPPNIVVICIPIKEGSSPAEFDTSKEQPVVPKSFFHYDTTISGARVRVIVSTEPIKRSVSDLYLQGKLSKEISPYDGRIVLHSHSTKSTKPTKKSPGSRRSRISKA